MIKVGWLQGKEVVTAGGGVQDAESSVLLRPSCPSAVIGHLWHWYATRTSQAIEFPLRAGAHMVKRAGMTGTIH